MAMIRLFRILTEVALVIVVSVLVTLAGSAALANDVCPDVAAYAQHRDDVDYWPGRIHQAANSIRAQADEVWEPYLQSVMEHWQILDSYTQEIIQRRLEETGEYPEIWTERDVDPEDPTRLIPITEVQERGMIIAYPMPTPWMVDEALDIATSAIESAVLPAKTLMDDPSVLLETAIQDPRMGGVESPPIPEPVARILVRAAYARLLSRLTVGWEAGFRSNMSAFECLHHFDNRFLDLFGLSGKLHYGDQHRGLGPLNKAINTLAFPFGQPSGAVAAVTEVDNAEATIRELRPFVDGADSGFEFVKLSYQLIEHIDEAIDDIEDEQVAGAADMSVVRHAFDNSPMSYIRRELWIDLEVRFGFQLRRLHSKLDELQDLHDRKSEISDRAYENAHHRLFVDCVFALMTIHDLLNHIKDEYFSPGGLQELVLDRNSAFRDPIAMRIEEIHGRDGLISQNYESLRAAYNALVEVGIINDH